MESPDLASLHKPDGVHLCAKQCSVPLEVCLQQIVGSVAANCARPGYAFKYHKYTLSVHLGMIFFCNCVQIYRIPAIMGHLDAMRGIG